MSRLSAFFNWLFPQAPRSRISTSRSKTGSSRQGEQDYRLLAESAADVILQVDRDLVSQYVSPSALPVLGWTPEEMLGRGPDAFVFAEDLLVIRSARDQKLLKDDRPGTEIIRMIRKDGGLIWMEGNARAVTDPVTGAPCGLVLVLRDITERKILEDQLSRQAMTDGLTALANRRAFDRALEREWQRTLRDGTQMSLLLIDVDHFKEFNDHYGHQAGDDCLRAVAAVVKAVAQRPGDLAARYGGDELAVILAASDLAGATPIAEHLRSSIQALRLPHAHNPEGNEQVSVSVGVATALCRIGGTVRMPESLLISADTALYRTKHAGRNGVCAMMVLASDGTSLEN